MQVISIDGPSKGGKTTVAKAMAAHFEALEIVEGPVALQTAGNFYRATTAALLLEKGCSLEPWLQNAALLGKLIEEVVEKNDVDDPTIWGDLDADIIENMVSVIGKNDAAQIAGEAWYERVVTKAKDDGVALMILEGRNPRPRINRFIKTGEVISALDLMLDCAPHVAAIRTLNGDGGSAPSEAAILAKTADIERRRYADKCRKTNPFVYPSDMLAYWPNKDRPQGTIERSRHNGRMISNANDIDDGNSAVIEWVLPQTIRMDVSLQDKLRMTEEAQNLAEIAYSVSIAEQVPQSTD